MRACCTTSRLRSRRFRWESNTARSAGFSRTAPTSVPITPPVNSNAASGTKWRARPARCCAVPCQDVAQPYRCMLAGHWQAAAQLWQSLGMPYEQALALAQGPESALREALVILDRLGAAPPATPVGGGPG